MKLSDYAKKIGVSYRTAHNHWKKGLLKEHQLATGTIIVELDVEKSILKAN
jgi:predicted site-specific integrase-resolvase